MRIDAIRRRLQKGMKPEEIPGAQCLGCGGFRCAYKIGKWVVKERARWGRRGRPPTKSAPFPLIQRELVGKRWEIQPLAKSLSVKELEAVGLVKEEESWLMPEGTNPLGLDIYDGNLGKLPNGQVVLFDW